MFYKALRTLDLRDASSDTGALVARVFKNDVGELLEKSPDQAWLRLVFHDHDEVLSDRQGWVRLEENGVRNLKEEAGAPPREELKVWAFLKGCVDAEIWANQLPEIKPLFLAADYLIALANIETGLKNLPNKRPDTDGVGPLQVSSKDWKAFIDGPGKALGFDDDDRDDPLDQIFGAAYSVALTIRAISDGIGKSNLATAANEDPAITGPYIPSYADVLVANITNPETAIKMRLEQLADHGSQSVETVFTGFSPEDVKKIVAYRPRFFRDEAAQKTETIDGAYARIEKALDEEFRAAFKLMQELTPEDLPKTDGKATWLDVASAEQTNWKQNLKNEATPAGTAKVIEYFKTIDVNTNKVLRWCGAFVGHCLKQAGGEVVNGAARAANWKNWGNNPIPLGQTVIPAGAVIVLSKAKGSGPSGHVGFFMQYDAATDEVELLGGNQGDTVKLSKFPRSRVVAQRWFSPTTADVQNNASSAIGNATPGKFDTLLNFIAQPESNKNYDAYVDHPGNKNDPKITAMTVDQILQWQKNHGKRNAAGKYQIVRDTLQGLLRQHEAKGSDLFDKATQDRLAIGLLEGAGLGKFLANKILLEDFATNIAMVWAAMPVPKDVVRKRDGKLIKKGQSYWTGVAGNKTKTEVDAFLAAIRLIQ